MKTSDWRPTAAACLASGGGGEGAGMNEVMNWWKTKSWSAWWTAAAARAVAAAAALGLGSAVVPAAAHAAARPELAASYYPYLKDCLATLTKLDANWDEITKTEDGDEIRRYIGTVGTTSPLYKIRPSIAAIQKADDLPDDLDVEELLNKSEELLQALVDVENMSYSANFADYSGGGQLSAGLFIKKSRVHVVEAKNALASIVSLLKAFDI
mmetsp:Transcript_6366/g.17889  ORF Transcript_6366/g.17889 Transcript_6366/m.17889 type:complete len:211 (-) Transcript_6366:56-688(-)